MALLNVLTAGVLMTALWYAVPTDATANMNLAKCDRKAMSYMTDLDYSKFKGRWYVDKMSTTATAQWPMGIAYDVRIPVTPSVSNKGDASPKFMVIAPTFLPWGNCKTDTWLYEMIGGKWSNIYQTKYYTSLTTTTPGYYVQWWDKYVLATDYTTTAVTWTEPLIGGKSMVYFGQLEILVRDGYQGRSNQDIVKQALEGFCKGEWLDVNSGMYAHLFNPSFVPCFKQEAP